MKSSRLKLGLFFLTVLFFGAFLGLSDDEAYYWVFAQRPGWGHAYHPPMIGWSIWFFEHIAGWFFATPQEWILRLPATVLMTGFLAIGIDWVRRARGLWGAQTQMGGEISGILSVLGLSLGCWMIVPDTPFLFFGALGFSSLWRVIVRPEIKPSRRLLGVIFLASVGALLSKFTAVLFGFSALLSILFLISDRRLKIRLGLLLLASGVVAAIPILIWNATHSWFSIQYQLQGRHQGGGFSFSRGLGFLALQLLLGGVASVYYLAQKSKHGFFSPKVAPLSVTDRYVLFWALPPVVLFSVQAFFSEPKLHWTLAGWVWVGFALAAQSGRPRFLRLQKAITAVILILFGISCYYPLIPKLLYGPGGPALNPNLDITNDFYGWRELREAHLDFRTPILGLRYQTASQAAFYLGQSLPVTLYPLSAGERDSWPNIIFLREDPKLGTKLARPITVVGDRRYSTAPSFAGGTCIEKPEFKTSRFDVPSRSILIWSCTPNEDTSKSQMSR